MEFLSPKFTTHKQEKKLKASLVQIDNLKLFCNKPTTATLESTAGMKNSPWKIKVQILAHVFIGRTHGFL